MFSQNLKKFVEENPKLVTMRAAGDNMFVLKYSRKVFYDALWNDFLEECRGTIVDREFNLISYPFKKIYNFGIEDKAPVLPDETCITAFRKVNGFMVSTTVHNGQLLVSTTGSTSGEHVDYAKEMMVKHAPLTDWLMVLNNADCQGMTFMFECVHPEDPHIVVEKSGMYLIGYRENVWGSKVGYNNTVIKDVAAMLKCYHAESYNTTVGQLKTMVKECRHEGFVAYTDDGTAFKIKSPHYLVSKWVARNPKTDKLMSDDFKKQIDEEYYPLLSAIRSNIVEYTALDEQARLAWVRNQMESA